MSVSVNECDSSRSVWLLSGGSIEILRADDVGTCLGCMAGFCCYVYKFELALFKNN